MNGRFSTNNRCLSGAHASSRVTMSASNLNRSCAPSGSLSAHNHSSSSMATSSSSAPTGNHNRQSEICRYVRMNNYGLVDGDKAHKDYLDKQTKKCLETLQPMTTPAPSQKPRRSRLPAPTLAQSNMPVGSGVSAGQGDLHVSPTAPAPAPLSARDRIQQRIAERTARNHATSPSTSSTMSTPSWSNLGPLLNQDSPPLHIIDTQRVTFKWMVENGYSVEKLKEIPFAKPGSIGRSGREYTLDAEFSRQELDSMFGHAYVANQLHMQRTISEKIRLKAIHGNDWARHFRG